jgi:hypothetical protein
MRIVYRLQIQQTITGTGVKEGVKEKGIVILAGIMPRIKWANII